MTARIIPSLLLMRYSSPDRSLPKRRSTRPEPATVAVPGRKLFASAGAVACFDNRAQRGISCLPRSGESGRIVPPDAELPHLRHRSLPRRRQLPACR